MKNGEVYTTSETYTAMAARTRDTVAVWRLINSPQLMYSINGGPPIPVEDELAQAPYLKYAGNGGLPPSPLKIIAMELLLRHTRECEATDAEEVTLP